MPEYHMPDTIDALIAQVTHFHHAQIHRGLEAMGLYRGQPRLLHILWQNDGLTHTDLANALHVQPATISKMVQRMERSGFVERRGDPEDERVSRVYLTDLGRNVRTQLESWFDTFQREYTTGLNDEDLVTLKRLLTHIRDRLAESYAADGDSDASPPPHLRHHGRSGGRSPH